MVYILFNTGSNVTLLNKKLAEQLDLNVEEYASTFWMASCAGAHFTRKLPRARLQLHDSLAVMVEGIRIINRTADCISIILGTGFFDPKGRFFHQCHLEERGH